MNCYLKPDSNIELIDYTFFSDDSSTRCPDDDYPRLEYGFSPIEVNLDHTKYNYEHYSTNQDNIEESEE